ncbi:hypothetical protein [Runella sp.]|uniref:hypothetical protein n=1 Tax=Runella sp. TaxID=1960881 RepID=UPI003D102DDE
MPEQKPSLGRIVFFHPGNSVDKQLPNGMEAAPAIITQVFSDTMVNLSLFLASPGGEPVRQEWSVSHKDAEYLIEGSHYWDWPPRV